MDVSKMKTEEPSTLEIISIDPLFGLHFLFSMLLIVPALIGFQAFESVLGSISETLGISISVFYFAFAAPSTIEISQTLFRSITYQNRSVSLFFLVPGSPALFWLALGISGINFMEQVATASGVSPSILYFLIGLLPLYPLVN